MGPASTNTAGHSPKRALTGAERKARQRRRARHDLWHIPLDLPGAWLLKLVSAGYLAEAELGDPDAISQAVARLDPLKK